MRTMLVIGLGRFGRNLSLKLTELGIDVTVIDKDEEKAKKVVHCVSNALIGDCTEQGVLQSMDIMSFDICFVCTGGNFQASLEITALLKELGAKYVVSKTDSQIHTKFLLDNGADDIVYIDRDIAQRTALKVSAKNAFDYIELTPDYAITDMIVPEKWAGLSLRALELGSKHNINVIGIKSGDKVIPVTDPDYVLTRQEHLIVAGLRNDLMSLIDK